MERVHTKGWTDVSDDAHKYIWLKRLMKKRGVPAKDVDACLGVYQLKQLAVQHGILMYSTYDPEAMSDNVAGTMLDQDIACLERHMIPVIVKTEEGVERTFLNRNAPLGPQLLDILGVSGGTVQAFYRGELDIKATPEENGIDDEATLTVQLAGISFPEVVQDLLLLNPKMTEEEATKGADLDADGNLISWDLSYCDLIKLPECIGGCTALQELILYKCTSLRSLGDGIGGCTALQTLNLMFCSSLASLGDGIGGCTALQKLNLEYCRSLASLGNGIGGCKALQKLTVSYCSNLTSLGDAIGGLTSLNSLNVGYTTIKELPESIGGCFALKELDCRFCTKLTSLGGIGGLTSLTTLDVSNTAIKELPESVKRLESQGCRIYL